MKFNKHYKYFTNLYTEKRTVEILDIHEGDMVVFRKDCWNNEYLKNLQNTSTGLRIKEMIAQTNSDNADPLIVTGLKSKRPVSYGSFGSNDQNSIGNEVEYIATVGQRYALGLYSNIVEVPLSCLQRVDTGNNLPPLSNKQQQEPYKQTTGEPPMLNPHTSDPTIQTHASWKDHGGKLPGSK